MYYSWFGPFGYVADISVTRTQNHRDVAVAFSGSHILHAKVSLPIRFPLSQP